MSAALSCPAFQHALTLRRHYRDCRAWQRAMFRAMDRASEQPAGVCVTIEGVRLDAMYEVQTVELAALVLRLPDVVTGGVKAKGRG